MKSFFPITFSVFLFVVLAYETASAQDRVFCRTYQTNILPYGTMELEYMNTVRSGRIQFYNAIDQRLELELGLGKNVQTSFYINMYSETMRGENNLIQQTSRTGFSNEWKIKLTDPVANRLGTALYGEIGFDGKEIEMEGKIILDKQIDKNLFAVNLVGEYEVHYEAVGSNTTTVSESPFELDLAYLRFIGSSAGLGLEIRNHNEVESGTWVNSAWFAGPTFHYHGKRFFINVNVIPQLFNAKKEVSTMGTRDLVDHEKIEGRVILSFSF